MKCVIEIIGGSDGIHDPDGFCKTHHCHVYSQGGFHPKECHMAAAGRTKDPLIAACDKALARNYPDLFGGIFSPTLGPAVLNLPKKGKPALPLDSDERKRWPLFSGLLRYFPAALANVSNHSFLGNEKHNPGKPMQHARDKSSDHEDCIMRHLMDASEHKAGSPQRIDELRGVAWRALALLQVECELAGYQTAPAATFNTKDKNV